MAVLLLNASFEPLRVISLHRALGLVLAGKAEPVAERDGEVVRSCGGAEFPVPVVVRLRYMVKVPYASRVPLNRRTLAWRDGGVCQVSGCARRGTTIDHVMPRSRCRPGEAHRWENVVLMCPRHNHTKGDRTLAELGWTLKATPRAPRGLVLLDASDPAFATWLPASVAAPAEPAPL